MPSKYVKEYQRKHKYSTRACSYYIKRISEPIEKEFQVYKSIRTMTTELKLSDSKVRAFFKSGEESAYIRSTTTGILYQLKRAKKDIAIQARCIEEFVNEEMEYQTFTSQYQLSKRFRISLSTIDKVKRSVPIGEETKLFVYDEFKRRYVLTFYK